MVAAQTGHLTQPGKVREGFLEEGPGTISKSELDKSREEYSRKMNSQVQRLEGEFVHCD